jgi:hypothetical protein
LIAALRAAETKTFPLGRAKRKGVGGKEFLPALAFAASFFAAAIFRANEIGAPSLILSKNP